MNVNEELRPSPEGHEAVPEARETISRLGALLRSSVPSRFFVAAVSLVVVASFLLHPPVEVRQSVPAPVKTLVAEAVPRPNAVCPQNRRVRKSASAGAPSGAPRTEPVYVPDQIVAGNLIHAARRGESLTAIARRYLPETSFMTVAELETAIRQVNGGRCGDLPSPGTPVTVPGYETGPVVERPVSIAKDYEVRAIYLTGLMAGSHQGIYLIRRWKELGGNAIVFDIKDSDGSISVPFGHELAPKSRPYIANLPKFARFLHSLGLHAIARIALFRDEQLVKHHPQLAVQSRRSHEAWRENGKLVWTDPSRPEVQDYNIGLARYAATSGVDEVQFDYVRFPAEGDQKDAQFLFQTAHPDWTRPKVISNFLARAYSELHPLGVLLSLDVFGVMAWQRSVDLAHTGQDIVAMARYCDVLSPMIYPSHFFGMDGYAHPGDAPEHFISESMERFEQITEGSGVVLRPWLQAFGWRTKTYSPGYILKQVNVARENDGIGYLFWNARNDYSKPFVAMAEIRALPHHPSPSESAAARRDEVSNSSSASPPARELAAPREGESPTPPAAPRPTAQ